VRVLIFGTGAVASLVGARLARSGCSVTLAGSWLEAIETINDKGLTVEEGGKVWSAPARALEASGPLPSARFVFVLVKSYQTTSIAPHVARAVSDDGFVVSLQNGLGHRETLTPWAGSERMVMGVVTVGARLMGPARVRAQGGSVILAASTLAPVDDVAALLRSSGFETKVSKNLDRVIWRKLAVNCSVNPLTALLGIENGALLKSKEARGRLVFAAREVGAVARAKGIDLGVDAAELALDVLRRTASNRSSMLQDLDRGAPTEIEALNGAVVLEGRRLGVPTPVNKQLLEAIRQRTQVV
jgi:2-dehydropantoate 2-reductase